MTDHLDHIMRVMDAAFDPQFGEAWTRRQVGSALTVPNSFYLFADSNGREPEEDSGIAGFTLSRGAAGEEELLLIAVLPEMRGKGVGSRLLERYIASARERGAEKIFLEMREGNPAQRLYERFGFQIVGRRRDYYRRGQTGPIDALTFALTN